MLFTKIIQYDINFAVKKHLDIINLKTTSDETF